MGDFNMVLAPLSEVAGMGIKQGSSADWLVQERAEVMQVFRTHRLNALNTWGRPTPTYHHPNGVSQIDYILVRKQLADAEARTCSVKDAPIAAWRSSGHKPLKGSIKLNWRPWSAKIRDRPIQLTSTPPIQQVLQDTEVSLETLQLAVKRDLDKPTPQYRMPQNRNVDEEIQQQWRAYAAPLVVAASRPPPPPTGEISMERHIWQAWIEAIRQQRAKREMRKLARARKRETLLATLQLAQDAYDAGDIRGHYKFIRKVAPKTFRRKICLKSADGHLLSSSEECQVLADYASKLFGRCGSFELPEMRPLPAEWFQADTWVQALKSLQNFKAVPQPSASVQCWKEQAILLAPSLERIAQQTLCSGTPYVPDHWAKVQLAWLPKPGRAPTSPSMLRTIGLMGPDTKALLWILKQQAQPWIQAALKSCPQYAYRQLSSTSDPLLRASLHCSHVRQKLAGYVDDHTAKIIGQADRELLGGIMLGIDLSKAFDALSYGEMLVSLRATGMPEHLCVVLLHIHAKTNLTIAHSGHTREVKMMRGLRQGCGIAPIIYACWTVRLCKVLDERLARDSGSSSTWTQDHMSIFADDKHCFWDIQSARDLYRAVKHIRVVISVITELGMKINFQKSVVTVTLKGWEAPRIMKKFFRQWSGSLCLALRMDEHDIYIPVSAHMQYLGTVLNYASFEQDTAKCRSRQANSNFAQLKKVLRTNGPLSQARKLQVYKACVWSSLLYGITAIGLTASACRTIRSTAAMHLRKILRIYEHGVSNAQVLERAGLDLLPHLEQHISRQARTLDRDEGRDVALKRKEETRLRQVREQLCILQAGGISQSLSQQDPTIIAQVPCPVCGIEFPSVEGLHQHLHRKHPEIEQAAKIPFSRQHHSLFGLPYCRFCRQRLGNWQALRKHVTQGMCLRLKQAFAQQQTESQLLQVIQMEEQRDPPKPPVGDSRLHAAH